MNGQKPIGPLESLGFDSGALLMKPVLADTLDLPSAVGKVVEGRLKT
jgi:hypothetical protein